MTNAVSSTPHSIPASGPASGLASGPAPALGSLPPELMDDIVGLAVDKLRQPHGEATRKGRALRDFALLSRAFYHTRPVQDALANKRVLHAAQQVRGPYSLQPVAGGAAALRTVLDREQLRSFEQHTAPMLQAVQDSISFYGDWEDPHQLDNINAIGRAVLRALPSLSVTEAGWTLARLVTGKAAAESNAARRLPENRRAGGPGRDTRDLVEPGTVALVGALEALARRQGADTQDVFKELPYLVHRLPAETQVPTWHRMLTVAGRLPAKGGFTAPRAQALDAMGDIARLPEADRLPAFARLFSLARSLETPNLTWPNTLFGKVSCLPEADRPAALRILGRSNTGQETADWANPMHPPRLAGAAPALSERQQQELDRQLARIPGLQTG